MPRIEKSANGGSSTADRALAVLSAFQSGDRSLSLAELTSRTGLYKSTILRLMNSLLSARFIARSPDGSYFLGPQIPRLNAIYTRTSNLEAFIMPVLQGLVAATRETAALHVRQGRHRLRMFWADSPLALREHIETGERLPLDRGAGGRVLLAFSGMKGAPYDRIRAQGYALSRGERLPELSGISAPVFSADRKLVGALTLTMPTQRWKEVWRHQVVRAAARLTETLGGTSADMLAKEHEPRTR
jgi:DNA-binding IclR family transcriptional regulator